MPLDLHPRFEEFGAEAATGGGQTLREMRRMASGMEDTAHLPALIDAAAVKRENILQRDRVSVHPDDPRLARPISIKRCPTLRWRSRTFSPISPATSVICRMIRVSTRTPSPNIALSVG